MINNSTLSYNAYYRKLSGKLNGARTRHLEVLKQSNIKRKRKSIYFYKEYRDDIFAWDDTKIYHNNFKQGIIKCLNKNADSQILIINNVGAYITKDYVFNFNEPFLIDGHKISKKIKLPFTNDNSVIMYILYNQEPKCYLYEMVNNLPKYVSQIVPFEYL
jgi:hypothetical protein